MTRATAFDDRHAGLGAALLADLGPQLVEVGASLAERCTYRVGGAAGVFVSVDAVATLEVVRDRLAEQPGDVPVLAVGRGSNLLVADRGFPGVVLQLGAAFDEIRIDTAGGTEMATVIVGGAALLPVVACRTVAAGLTGFEWAVGVPGSVGGAVRMNAGGHGADMAASLVRISSFRLRAGDDGGGPIDRPVADLDLAYRSSAIDADEIVLFAELALSAGDRAEAEDRLREIVAWRREHQPGGQNAGSVFTNPPGDSAGRLVDTAGCKGLRIGTAEVSTKHANFIQADSGGSADDVRAVIEEVQRRVREVHGVDLHPEHHLVGFDEPDPAPTAPADPATECPS